MFFHYHQIFHLKILDPIESQGEQKLINLSEFQNIWDNKIIDLNIVRGKSSKERKFNGLLPKGEYSFIQHPFTVEPGVDIKLEISPKQRRTP